MNKKYKSYKPEFKLKVALEALKNEKTTNQIASDYEISKSLVCDWKKCLIQKGSNVFQNINKKAKNKKEDVDFLQQQIGRLTVELEWLKKKLGITQ